MVSIIVPCFNQAQYLNEALQSIYEQTYSDWECIIVNDGSHDNTEEIAQQWSVKDQRFRYFYKENEGVSSARNFGVLHSIGEYILPLDSDDKIGKEYIKLAINEFQIDGSLCLVYAYANFFGEVNKFWDLPDFEFKKFLLSNCIYCSAIFKRIDFFKIGGYDENMKFGFEDWEFWINLISKYDAPKVKRIDYLGFYYRRKIISRDLEILNDETKMVETKFEIYKKHHILYDKHFGGYIDNLKDLNNIQNDIKSALKSEKFVLNLFTKMFLGLKFFKTNDFNFFK